MTPRLVVFLLATAVAPGQAWLVPPPGGSPPPYPAGVLATVSPIAIPPGGDLWLSVTNQSTATFFLNSACPYVIVSLAGATIFTPVCTAVAPTLAVGGSYATSWNGRDQTGALVPDGVYAMVVLTPNGQSLYFPFTISATYGVGVAQRASLVRGQSAGLAISAPAFPNAQFFAAASGATLAGISTCGGTLPLQLDPLFFLSVTPGNGVFNGMSGVLSPLGRSLVPSIAVPNIPALAGFTFVVAAVVYQPTGACQFPAVSAATQLTVL